MSCVDGRGVQQRQQACEGLGILFTLPCASITLIKFQGVISAGYLAIASTPSVYEPVSAGSVIIVEANLIGTADMILFPSLLNERALCTTLRIL